MAKWTAFPHDAGAYTYDAGALKKKWARLHAGDAEPLPKDAAVLAAWALFHAGEFQKATEAGLKAHAAGAGAGMTVANKAQAIYATYLESSEKTKLALLHRGGRARRGAAPGRTRRTPTPGTAWPMRSAATARASASPRRWRRAWAPRSRTRSRRRSSCRPSMPTRTSRSAPSTPR